MLDKGCYSEIGARLFKILKNKLIIQFLYDINRDL